MYPTVGYTATEDRTAAFAGAVGGEHTIVHLQTSIVGDTFATIGCGIAVKSAVIDDGCSSAGDVRASTMIASHVTGDSCSQRQTSCHIQSAAIVGTVVTDLAPFTEAIPELAT